jgi:hypothetical protein
MHLKDFSSSEIQFIAIGLLSIAFLTLVTRAIIFFQREKTGAYPVYPSAWNKAQCQALEHFRLLVGLALIPLWAAFLYVYPSLRTDWASGHLHLFFFILLLWISNAWVLLLVPRNWQRFGAISRSFWIVIVFLTVWWGTVFTATAWMFVKASTTPSGLSGPYAVLNVPSFD